MRHLATTYMSRLGSLRIIGDEIDMFLRQRSLPGHTILGARFLVNLVPDTPVFR